MMDRHAPRSASGHLRGDRAATPVQVHIASTYDRGPAGGVVTQAGSSPSRTAHPDGSASSGSGDATTAALAALWRLESTAWRYFYEQANRHLQATVRDQHDGAADSSGEASTTSGELRAEPEAAVRFRAEYFAWKRYAETDLGVSLEAFLTQPFDESSTAARSKVDLMEHTAQLTGGRQLDDVDIAGPDGDTDDAGSGSGEYSVAALADQKYRAITEPGGLV